MAQRKKWTRRKFLRRAGPAAGALIAAPYAITSNALGQGGTLPASERITIGHVGCGNRGRSVMKGLVAAGAQVVATCDCYEERRRAVADLYDAEPYADYRDLLARDDIDAILNATPEHWHATISVEACRQGKDVYCEKPLSLTIREAQVVRAAARRYERVFQVGTQQRSDPTFRFACELVRNGYIGEVQNVITEPGGTSRHCQLPAQPVPKGLDWDMWLGPAPWAPYHEERCTRLRAWWNWRDYSGGLMTDRGAHDFDMVQWGLGMDGSGPIRAHLPDGKDFKQFTYEYPSGALMRADIAGWGKRPALVIFEGTEGKVSVWRGGIETTPASLADVQIGPDEIHLYESTNHQANFIDCVRSRERPAADVAIGAGSVIVCHVGNIAYWLNRSVEWDPATEKFVGDDQAQRLTSRPMRAPWRV